MAQNDEGQGRSLWFMVSAMVVVLVLIAAAVLTIANLIGDDEPEATPSSSAETSKSESVCGLEPKESSADNLTSAPKTKWRLIDRVAAPEVEEAGPGKIGSDQFGSCFAQSPTGAVVAAANIVASTTTPERQAKAYEELAVDGPGRTKILQSLKDGEFEDTPEISVQIAGFRIERYTDKEASIDLALAVDGETYMSSPMELRWVDGDWKVVVNDDGSVYDAQPVDDLSDYVVWSGA